MNPRFKISNSLIRIPLCLQLMGMLLFSSCASTKHLKEGELLLRRNSIHLITDKTYVEKSILKDELENVLIQKNNTYLFGIFPVKIGLYNMRYKKHAAEQNLNPNKTKLWEAPVVFDSNAITGTATNMKNMLHNQGYFDAEIETTTSIKKKKAYVHYNVNTQSSYLIDNIQYHVDSSSLQQEMLPVWEKGSLLKRGKSYSNALLSQERSDMVMMAKNRGYYKFNTDNIFFELDTAENRHLKYKQNIFENAMNVFAPKTGSKKPTVAVTTYVKEEEDYQAFQKFKYKNIYVYPEYTDGDKIDNNNYYEQTIDGLTFRYKHKTPFVHLNALKSKIFLRPKQNYSQSDYDNTLLQLNDLGIFHYARIYIREPQQDSVNNELNAYILLSPTKKYDFNTNFEVSGGDLYVAGSAVNASVTNKNFLKGANQLTAALTYGVELNQDKKSDKSYFERFYLLTQNLGMNFRILFPKYLLPFSINSYKGSSPKTILAAGINTMDRNGYFRLQNINASYGYLWKENEYKSWQVNPIFINSLRLRNVSDSFKVLMNEVQAIRNSYQETFIEGENVEYIYSTEGKNTSKYTYLKLGADEAGLLMKGIDGIARNIGKDNGLQFNYATYVRFDFDARQYFLRRNTSFNFRFYGGFGIPYGGSKTLPYIKQFFVGGPYSIRGWGPRLLGPGSYYNEQAQSSSERLFIDQSGDIKLELNSEYRFKMITIFAGAIDLHGALFADAGNIWLSHADASMPGAEFQINKLAQDIAVSTGIGLRANIAGFLILRADWAFPLKKPYVFNGHKGWVLNEIDFNSKQWRKNNINLNIAIGMPF